MIKKYEDACKAAGLTEKKTMEIRRVFEGDKKRLQRENAVLEGNGILIFSMFDNTGDSDDEIRFNIPDPGLPIEELYIKKMEIETLHTALMELGKEDIGLLRAFFDDGTSFDAYVRSVGGKRTTMLRRKDKLVRLLRKRMKDWL